MSGVRIMNLMKMIKLFLISTSKTPKLHHCSTGRAYASVQGLGNVEYKKGGNFTFYPSAQRLLSLSDTLRTRFSTTFLYSSWQMPKTKNIRPKKSAQTPSFDEALIDFSSRPQDSTLTTPRPRKERKPKSTKSSRLQPSPSSSIDPLVYPSLCPDPTPSTPHRHRKPESRVARKYVPFPDPLKPEESVRLSTQEAGFPSLKLLPPRPLPRPDTPRPTASSAQMTMSWQSQPYASSSMSAQDVLPYSTYAAENSTGSSSNPITSDTPTASTLQHDLSTSLATQTILQTLFPYLYPIPTLPYHPSVTTLPLPNQHMAFTEPQLPIPEPVPTIPHLPAPVPMTLDPTLAHPVEPAYRTSLDCSTSGSQTQSPMPRLSTPSTTAPTTGYDPRLCDTSSLLRESGSSEMSFDNSRNSPTRVTSWWEPWSGTAVALPPTSWNYEPSLTYSPMSHLPNDPQIPQHPNPYHDPLLLPPTVTHEPILVHPQPLHPAIATTPPRHLTDLPASPIQVEWENAFAFLNPDYIMTSPITTPPTTMETAQQTLRHRRSAVQRRRCESLPVRSAGQEEGDQDVGVARVMAIGTGNAQGRSTGSRDHVN